jgi:HK97 family phage major capsid protein
LTGTGAGEPLGVFTASVNGISTGRDVSTGNSTTAVTFDGLIEAKYSLKAGYWRRARWMFHRDVIKGIAKLKDGEGQYIWRESVRVGEAPMLLGCPVLISEYAPNTLTSGLYAGIIGDFGYYWIADALSMQVQRINELYAASNQTGFIGRMETDGMPVLEEAFARVTLA